MNPESGRARAAAWPRALPALLLAPVLVVASAAQPKAGEKRICVPSADAKSWECGTPDNPPPERGLPMQVDAGPGDAPPPFLASPPSEPAHAYAAPPPEPAPPPSRPLPDEFPPVEAAAAEAAPEPVEPEPVAEAAAEAPPVAEAPVAEAPVSEPPFPAVAEPSPAEVPAPPPFLAAPESRRAPPLAPMLAPAEAAREAAVAEAASEPPPSEPEATAPLPQPAPESPAVAPEPVAEASVPPEAVVAPEPVALPRDDAAAAAAQAQSLATAEPEPPTGTVPTETAPDAAVEAPIAVEAPAVAIEPMQAAAAEPAPPAVDDLPVAEANASAAPGPSLTEAPPAATTPTTVVPERAPATAAAAESAAPAQAAPATTPTAPSTVRVRDASEFLRLPAGAWTVQLGRAVGDPQAAVGAAIGNGRQLGEPLYLVAVGSAEPRQWLLLWSSFADADAARMALRTAGLAGTPRRIGPLATEVRAAGSRLPPRAHPDPRGAAATWVVDQGPAAADRGAWQAAPSQRTNAAALALPAAASFAALPASAWTVQLARAGSSAGFDALLTRLGLAPGDCHVVEVAGDGATTYLLLWSQFPDADAARAAARTLPGGSGAFVRRIGPLQSELRTR